MIAVHLKVCIWFVLKFSARLTIITAIHCWVNYLLLLTRSLRENIFLHQEQIMQMKPKHLKLSLFLQLEGVRRRNLTVCPLILWFLHAVCTCTRDTCICLPFCACMHVLACGYLFKCECTPCTVSVCDSRCCSVFLKLVKPIICFVC